MDCIGTMTVTLSHEVLRSDKGQNICVVSWEHMISLWHLQNKSFQLLDIKQYFFSGFVTDTAILD